MGPAGLLESSVLWQAQTRVLHPRITKELAMLTYWQRMLHVQNACPDALHNAVYQLLHLSMHVLQHNCDRCIYCCIC